MFHVLSQNYQHFFEKIMHALHLKVGLNGPRNLKMASKYHDKWFLSYGTQNRQNNVLISNGRIAWPTVILMSSLDNLLLDAQLC